MIRIQDQIWRRSGQMTTGHTTEPVGWLRCDVTHVARPLKLRLVWEKTSGGLLFRNTCFGQRNCNTQILKDAYGRKEMVVYLCSYFYLFYIYIYIYMYYVYIYIFLGISNSILPAKHTFAEAHTSLALVALNWMHITCISKRCGRISLWTSLRLKKGYISISISI